MSDWSLPVEATHWLRDHIPHGSTVLELGSGEGTKRLSEWFAVKTVEHNTEWIIRDVAGVECIYAPIRNGWYDAAVMRKLTHHYDAIVVDGPPGNIGRWGFMEHLDMFRHDVPILLDDIHRPAERELAVTVANALGKTLSMHLLTDGRAFGVVGML